jgi:hypothetical protein
VLVLTHLRYAGAFADAGFLRDLTDALRTGPGERYFADYDALFAFVRRDDDLRRLADAVAGSDPGAAAVAFCDANPPVFATAPGATDFNSLGSVRVLGINQSIFRVVIDADGRREATVRFITFRGEAHVYVLAAAAVYRFTIAEAILAQAVARIALRHPANAGTARALFYPSAYRIHRELLLVECQAVASFRDAAAVDGMGTVLARASVEPGEAPRSCAERQSHCIESGRLREWLGSGADGSKCNFIFMRSAFAASLAAAAAMHEVFGSNGWAISPFLFAADRHRVFEPGFVADGSERVWHFLPITDQIAGALPKFVLNGAFATAWNTIMSGMAEKMEKIRVVIEALLPEKDEAFIGDIERRVQKMGVKIVDGEPAEVHFPFDLMEQMIENSNNVWKAQTNRFGWL